MTGIEPGLVVALLLLLFGSRWAFRAERVVANPNSSLSDPRRVRRFGFVLIGLGAAILLVLLVEFLLERS